MSTVAIVGAGPAGCRLALQLANARFDVRLIAGPPTSKVYLETLSARAADSPLGSGEIVTHASAWGSAKVYEHAAIFSPWGSDRLVARPALDLALRRLAVEAGAHIIEDVLRAAERVGVCWRLSLASGRCITADVVVDATGRRRKFARLLRVPRAARFDRLVAYPARLIPSVHGPNTTTLVLSDQDGWWYVGSAREGGLCAVYFTDGDLVGPSPLRQIAASWRRVRGNLPEPMHIAEIGTPQPAYSECLCRPVGDAWLAIGDAAAAFDPLSSSGLYFAQASADWAAEAILATALEAYGSTVTTFVGEFLLSRRKVYGGEHRFANLPFWSRRQMGTSLFKTHALQTEGVQ